MEKLDPSVAQQIAQAAIAFQQQRTGHEPKSVAVVLSGDTLLITLQGALSPAEQALAKSPAGAAQVQEFHRQLFTDSADALRQEIKTNYRGRGARSDRRSRADFGHGGPGLHDRHDGAGVLARRGRTRGQLERQWIRRTVTKNGGFAMLVLSRKSRESVVVGGADGFRRLLKVTVLGIQGKNVKLGFEVDPDVPVHRSEVWERIRAAAGQVA